jgi:hypothetical protein
LGRLARRDVYVWFDGYRRWAVEARSGGAEGTRRRRRFTAGPVCDETDPAFYGASRGLARRWRLSDVAGSFRLADGPPARLWAFVLAEGGNEVFAGACDAGADGSDGAVADFGGLGVGQTEYLGGYEGFASVRGELV